MKRIVAATAVLLLLAGCGGHKKRAALAAQKMQFGTSKLSEGNPEGALADLSEAHKLDPKNAEIAQALGLAYWDKSKLLGDDTLKLDAEKYMLLSFKLKKKAEDVPGDWHNNLGALYVDMKRYGDAVKQLEIAIRDPEYRTPERPNNNIALAFLQQGDCQKASEYADKALRIQPRFCMALINKAKADECLAGKKQGDPKETREKLTEAIEAYAGAIRECPEYPEPYLRSGLLALKLGKKAEAMKQWQAAKQRDPSGPVGKEAEKYLRTMGP